MVLLKNFGNIFKIPELTRKLMVTLGILIVYRLGIFIPAVGMNVQALTQMLKESGALQGFFSYIDLFSGGSLSTSSIFALGIGPYITASIMMQMLTLSIPYLEQLNKEGEIGRKTINQYTRYLAIGLTILYAFGLATTWQAKGVLLAGLGYKLLFILSLTTGAAFVMWLAEQISLFGIGNGSSMIIFSGIIANFPGYVRQTYIAISTGNISALVALLFIAILVLITAGIVFLEKGERKIPVQYARRVVGQRVYAGQSTYIPFKINTSGVMPVIFASSLLNMPLFLINLLASYFDLFKPLQSMLHHGGLLYSALEFALIIFFTYFYTAIIFNPSELADNMKKGGGFVPGIRPGKQTANYFDYILNRIGLIGSLYLGVLAIAPNLVRLFINVPFILSGTSLLIMVGVALETAAQVESYLIEHKYEGLVSSGKVKNRISR